MRPVKQAGVVTTHSLVFFAPAASAVGGGALLLTHVTRFAFMFISAAMLVYAYPDLARWSLKTFWRRRLLAVALPYIAWTLLYFGMESLPLPGIPGAFRPTGGIVGSASTSFEHLGYLLGTGYYQLYYLVLLLEFYAVYPAFLWFLRATERHHAVVFAASVVLQLVLVSLLHWGVVPGWLKGGWATRELWNYQLYLVAGGLMAWHYDEMHAWLRRHWALVLATTVASVALAEGWYVLGRSGVVPGLTGVDSSGPFQPILVPAFLAVIGALYVLGVAMASSRLSTRVRGWVVSGADNSYGVYLSQVLFISLLAVAGWRRLEAAVPWPLVVSGAVVIVYSAALGLTSLLARMPGSRATAGRVRRRFRTGGTRRPLIAWPGWRPRGHLVALPSIADPSPVPICTTSTPPSRRWVMASAQATPDVPTPVERRHGE